MPFTASVQSTRQKENEMPSETSCRRFVSLLLSVNTKEDFILSVSEEKETSYKASKFIATRLYTSYILNKWLINSMLQNLS